MLRMQEVDLEGIVCLMSRVVRITLPHALRRSAPVAVMEFHPFTLLDKCANSILRIGNDSLRRKSHRRRYNRRKTRQVENQIYRC